MYFSLQLGFFLARPKNINKKEQCLKQLTWEMQQELPRQMLSITLIKFLLADVLGQVKFLSAAVALTAVPQRVSGLIRIGPNAGSCTSQSASGYVTCYLSP